MSMCDMSEDIIIQDESGDKKYFVQLPHYVLNHSTANDQALYWQMKRYAGESGKCFASQETLMQKMGIGRKAFNKSLQYLLEQGWIKFIGMTPGKTRPIKTYSISDIWKLNVLHYEKIPAERAVSFQEIPAESNGDTGQKNSKIPAERAVEEDLLLRRIKNKRESADALTPAEAMRMFVDSLDYQEQVISKMASRATDPGQAAAFIRAEVTKFLNYWTEPTKSGKQQKWEKQETFELGRRLATWFGNADKFNRYQVETKGVTI